MTMPGSMSVSPTSSTRTLRSIWATTISMCLSSISTRCDTVHVLDFVQQVLLHGLFAADTRRMSCGTSGPRTSASPARTMSPACTSSVLAVRNDVLDLGAVGAAGR